VVAERASLCRLKDLKIQRLKSMTKSFDEFEVHKKGVVLTKLVFELLNNKSFCRRF
jgi:hypothetical protein